MAIACHRARLALRTRYGSVGGKPGAATAANGYHFGKSQGKPNTLIRR
jgi:hypothetical protein